MTSYLRSILDYFRTPKYTLYDSYFIHSLRPEVKIHLDGAVRNTYFYDGKDGTECELRINPDELDMDSILYRYNNFEHRTGRGPLAHFIVFESKTDRRVSYYLKYSFDEPTLKMISELPSGPIEFGTWTVESTPNHRFELSLKNHDLVLNVNDGRFFTYKLRTKKSINVYITTNDLKIIKIWFALLTPFST